MDRTDWCFGRKCPALLDKDFSYDSKLNMAEWLIPIYMSCTECGLFLGSIEEDCADMLGGMCLECFRKMTDQKNRGMMANDNASRSTK